MKLAGKIFSQRDEKSDFLKFFEKTFMRVKYPKIIFHYTKKLRNKSKLEPKNLEKNIC